MATIFSFIATFALLVFAALPLWAVEEGDAVGPQELFVSTHKCNTCHSVDAAGVAARSEKMKSKDLSGFQTDDLEALARFLRKQEPRDEAEHKKAFKGSDEELRAIVEWLGSLETQDS